jgi:hypothetical protein
MDAFIYHASRADGESGGQNKFDTPDEALANMLSWLSDGVIGTITSIPLFIHVQNRAHGCVRMR